MARKRLSYEIDNAFGPLEWFKADDDGLAVSTHWPTFSKATAARIAEALNAVLRPHVEEARVQLLQELQKQIV